MKLNIYQIKKFTPALIILQLAISLKSYSEIIKTNNSKELKWELLEKNVEGNIKWEILPKSEKIINPITSVKKIAIIGVNSVNENDIFDLGESVIIPNTSATPTHK